jgi:hypothetical protein
MLLPRRRAAGAANPSAAAAWALALLLCGVALLAAAPGARRAVAARVTAALAPRLSLAPPPCGAPPSQGVRSSSFLEPSDAAALHLKMYLWEVTNPADVLSGAAPPALRERGPWTYARRLTRERVPPPGGNATACDGEDGTMWCVLQGAPRAQARCVEPRDATTNRDALFFCARTLAAHAWLPPGTRSARSSPSCRLPARPGAATTASVRAC